jgi:hypothetical protein
MAMKHQPLPVIKSILQAVQLTVEVRQLEWHRPLACQQSVTHCLLAEKG